MASYENGTVIGKEVTDKQGDHGDVEIPAFMRKNAPIPDHVKNLKAEKITLPFGYAKYGKWVVLVRNVLTKSECDELIKFSEGIGYEDALVNIGYGRQKKIDNFRNCKRMMIDNKPMANCLWSRLTQFIPTYFERRKKIAFNERLRFLRYHSGEFFAPHFDGTYIRPNGERSQLTLLLYLNDGFVGARTNLLDTASDQYHAPEITTGMVIMFQHDIYHEGALLKEGTKYIIRTDVMYSSKKYSEKKINKEQKKNVINYVEYKDWKMQQAGHENDDKNNDDNDNDDDEKKDEEQENKENDEENKK